MIDFVYDKRLRLRGLQRTCRSRNSEHPCVNCVFRRKCLNPTYEYFLRPIGNSDPQSIDECLAYLLGHRATCIIERRHVNTTQISKAGKRYHSSHTLAAWRHRQLTLDSLTPYKRQNAYTHSLHCDRVKDTSHSENAHSSTLLSAEPNSLSSFLEKSDAWVGVSSEH